MVSLATLSSIEEMNRAHAVILHKGHGKDINVDSSYRTISSCPFIAKTIDIYLGKLSMNEGKGMSHEKAALLLSITIQKSLNDKKPIVTTPTSTQRNTTSTQWLGWTQK